MLTNAEKNMSIMAHNNIWSSVKYTVVIGDVLVRAEIPQDTLVCELFTGIKTIPPQVVALLRSPSPDNKMKLRAVYGVKAEYTPVISTGNFARKEAA